MKLDSTTALVTGAASGLGRAIAVELAAPGRTLWLTDLSEEALEGVAAEVTERGATARLRRIDVADGASWTAAREAIGPVDLLVNNAGVADVGPLLSTTDRQWERQIGINLMGVVRGSRAFVPAMVQQGRGHVVNIASFAGLAMAPGMIAYNTAKGGVVAFSESLRVELALEGVGVSVCCPAFFRTNLTESLEDASPAMVKRIHGWMDGSGVTAEDVAKAVVTAVQKDTFMVLTHPTTWRYWMLKRLLPERYRAQLLAQAQKRRKKASGST